MDKIKILRKKYPIFIYEAYHYRIAGSDLLINFDFRILPDFHFRPKVKIKNIPKRRLKKIKQNTLKNFIFHLGLAEIPSYWKLTCSPKIKIKAGFLGKSQKKWWKNLLLKGLGEFFYKNHIDFTSPSFISIETTFPKQEILASQGEIKKNAFLVPVGGGKDSALTLELLTKTRQSIYPFSLNQNSPAKEVIKVSGWSKNTILAERYLDKKLLELNRKAFLNGHTPFSAYLSFLSLLVALIFNLKSVVLSNERSANEGNLKYHNIIINHQYSKSFAFERLFRQYVKTYLTKDINYFSLLRPLYELQIVKRFAQYPKYFPAFLSCNEAFKTNSGRKKPTGKWCGKCPKCLFVFISLYPFLEDKTLIKIFNKNLFGDKSLLPLMKELTGQEKSKPFECVGTKNENLAALYLGLEKAKKTQKNPYLLKYFKEKILPLYPNIKKITDNIISAFDEKNNLSTKLKKLVKKQPFF